MDKTTLLAFQDSIRKEILIRYHRSRELQGHEALIEATVISALEGVTNSIDRILKEDKNA